jgi:antitoxin HicB
MAKSILKELQTLDYRKELFKNNGRWFARFPDLPGCLADGETEEEALARGNEAKSLWLEIALKAGKDIPQPSEEPPYSGRLNVRLPKGLHETAARFAEREGVSLNTYLVQLISEGVERSGVKTVFGMIEGQLRKFFRNIDLSGDPSEYVLQVGIQKRPRHEPEEFSITDATSKTVSSEAARAK